MSLFLPNIPQPGDNLDFSQGQLLSNNQGLDTVFGIDHYKFSDATSNKGFHNTVTQPQYITSPPTLPSVHPTTTTSAVLYGYQPLDMNGNVLTNTGLIQYSRGPDNAVPSPVTTFQSPSSALTLSSGGTLEIFDFTGLPRAITKLIIVNLVSSGSMQLGLEFDVAWTGSVLMIGQIASFAPTGTIVGQQSGNALVLKNNGAQNYVDIYWTMQLWRLS